MSLQNWLTKNLQLNASQVHASAIGRGRIYWSFSGTPQF